jgi:hypothetical protein
VEILSDFTIKQRIHSLYLSNNRTCGQIQAFLSYFPLHEFSNLQSLTLIDVNRTNVKQLQSILPSVPQLSCLHIIDLGDKVSVLIRNLPVSKLRILSIPTADPLVELSSITHLTINECDLGQLSAILQYIPMVKYLNVRSLSQRNHSMIYSHQAIYLEELIFDGFRDKLEQFEKFIQQTPNIKKLILSSYNNTAMIDALHWERLITSSLCYLKTFQFKFGYTYPNETIDLISKFEEFQNHFWQVEHPWFTEYSLSHSTAYIYTIPYISKEYFLFSTCIRYSNQNSIHPFNNVKNLMLFDEVFTCRNNFPNVTSLTILRKGEKSLLTEGFIQQLREMINLSHLVHFKFSSVCALGLLHILREAPRLLSIKTDQDILISLFDNHELCKIFHEKIRILDTGDNSPRLFKNSDEINRLCEIFSNVEHFICNVKQSTDVLPLLTRLPKLSSLKAFVNPLGKNFVLFENEIARLNLKIRMKIDPFTNCAVTPINFYIWI